MGIALSWLGVFFVIYLVMPIFYELLKEIKAKKEIFTGETAHARIRS